MRRLVLLALFCPAIALSAQGQYTISVDGVIHSNTASAPIAVMLYVGSGSKCSGSPDAVADANGRFSFVQTVERSWTENFAVRVRTFIFCVRENEQWTELWSIRTGPSPDHLVFDCAPPGSSRNRCRVEWDGRVWPDVQLNSAMQMDAFSAPLRGAAHRGR